VGRTGAYRVKIRYAAPKEHAGRTYIVAVGPHEISAEVRATGDWFQYATFDLGTVTIARAGTYVVTVRPAGAAGRELMYFKSLTLEQAIEPSPIRPEPGGK
jgi:hypothetical protein